MANNDQPPIGADNSDDSKAAKVEPVATPLQITRDHTVRKGQWTVKSFQGRPNSSVETTQLTDGVAVAFALRIAEFGAVIMFHFDPASPYIAAHVVDAVDQIRSLPTQKDEPFVAAVVSTPEGSANSHIVDPVIKALEKAVPQWRIVSTSHDPIAEPPQKARLDLQSEGPWELHYGAGKTLPLAQPPQLTNDLRAALSAL